MPYDPHVENTAGASIAHGIDVAAQAITEGMKEHHQNAQQNDYVTQQLRDLGGRKGPDGRPLMTMDMLKKSETGNLAQKKAMLADALFNNEQAYRSIASQQGQQMTAAQLNELQARTHGQQIQNQSAPAMNAATLNETQSRTSDQQQRLAMDWQTLKDNEARNAPFTPKAFSLTDPVSGQPMGMVSTSRESAVPLEHPPTPPQVIQTPQGGMFWNGKAWQEFKGANGERGKKDSDRVAQIDAGIASLIGKAKGAGQELTDRQPGSTMTYQQQIDGLQAERDALMGASPSAMPAQGGQGGQGGEVQTSAQSQRQFTKGQRVKQGGVTYEYDGSGWSPAQ